MALIVAAEDEPALRSTLGTLLQRAGHRVVLAADGDEAHRLILEEKPDLVLTDHHMPGTNGYTLCERLRADPATADIPVLLITGSATPDDPPPAQGLNNFDGYLAKPFDRRVLLDAIATILGA